MFASFARVFAVGLCIKILLFRSYFSTDFDVHRNWLAVTSSLPLKQWYTDTTNPWTLDYPPFFAYFEKVLSYFASAFDPKLTDLIPGDYRAWSAVVFQRSSVIATELVLVAAVWAFVQWSRPPSTSRTAVAASKDTAAAALLFLSLHLHCGPALLIVDHLHFQYNGFLFGVWVWSIAFLAKGLQTSSSSDSSPSMPFLYLAALAFASLLHLKHLFVFSAPSYLVLLLRAACLPPGRPLSQLNLGRLLLLGVCVIAVSAVSLLPFALSGALPALLSRLFPFQRGLCHAYWAPNFWALYAAADRILSRLSPSPLSLPSALPPSASLLLSKLFILSNAKSTAGGGFGFHSLGGCPTSFLPEPTPLLCLLLSFAASLPFLARLWARPTLPTFLLSLAGANLGAFLFGFHVHEKAILNTLIPLLLFEAYSVVNGAGRLPWLPAVHSLVIASLLPLLHRHQEYPLALAFLAWTLVPVIANRPLDSLFRSNSAESEGPGRVQVSSETDSLLASFLRCKALGLIPLFLVFWVLFPAGLLPLGLTARLPFLPLLAVSVYGGVAFVALYGGMVTNALRSRAL